MKPEQISNAAKIATWALEIPQTIAGGLADGQPMKPSPPGFKGYNTLRRNESNFPSILADSSESTAKA